jgi:hypothetical protein
VPVFEGDEHTQVETCTLDAARSVHKIERVAGHVADECLVRLPSVEMPGSIPRATVVCRARTPTTSVPAMTAAAIWAA